jgi:hypothetical protein
MLVTPESFTEAAKTMWRVEPVCFYCSEKTERVPLIMWHGFGEPKAIEIWLHPPCAVRLATGLLMDARKMEKEESGKGSVPEEFRNHPSTN